MDNINIRTFDERSNQMFYWGIGDFSDDGSSCTFPSGHLVKCPHMLCSFIKDEDDVKVYSGDIIHFNFGIPPTSVHGEVVFRDGVFEVLTPKQNPTSILLKDLKEAVGEFYVVGNTHQNKDLLDG